MQQYKVPRIQFGEQVDHRDHQSRTALSHRCADAAIVALEKTRKLSYTSGSFTHKCTCPSKEHKQGKEKTPSFYISSTTGKFYCFGCGIHGNAFDLLAMLGEDDEAAFVMASKDAPINISARISAEGVAERSHRKLVLGARKWLRSRIGTETWSRDFASIQEIYKRADIILNATSEVDTPEVVYGRFLALQEKLKLLTGVCAAHQSL